MSILSSKNSSWHRRNLPTLPISFFLFSLHSLYSNLLSFHSAISDRSLEYNLAVSGKSTDYKIEDDLYRLKQRIAHPPALTSKKILQLVCSQLEITYSHFSNKNKNWAVQQLHFLLPNKIVQVTVIILHMHGTLIQTEIHKMARRWQHIT